MPEDDVTKDEGKQNEHINVKVQGQDGTTVHFKIKRATQLKKLMSAYCDRQGLKMDTVRFMFDGQTVQAIDTAADHDMEDGDVIEVFQQQTGGFWA